MDDIENIRFLTHYDEDAAPQVMMTGEVTQEGERAGYNVNGMGRSDGISMGIITTVDGIRGVLVSTLSGGAFFKPLDKRHTDDVTFSFARDGINIRLCAQSEGATTYTTLAPSNTEICEDEPNVFVYEGDTGRVALDRPLVHFALLDQ
jgi:hypothetical protein